MTKTSNVKCREFVEKRKPFTASNLCGKETIYGYVVYSYGWWPLFIYTNSQWYEMETKYSRSTSRQQMYANPHQNNINLSRKEMFKLIGREDV